MLRGKMLFVCLLLLGLAAGSVLALLPRTGPPLLAAAAPVAQRPAAPPLEEPLPEGALARLGTTRFRNGFAVFGVAFSPDGKTIVSTGAGRGLCLWEANTGRLLHHCSGQSTPYVWALALSLDGRTVADGEGRVIKMWSVESGKERRQLTGHTTSVRSLAFSPRGDLLASGGTDATVRLWQSETGRALQMLEGHGGYVWALAFRHDGKVLASCSEDGTVRLWDPLAGIQLHVCKGHTKEVFCLAFTPGGKRLVSGGYAGDVREWDSDTGKQVRLLANEEGAVSSLAFSPDGRTLAVGRIGTIVLHDAHTGKELNRWKAHISRVNSLAWSPDGKTLVSGAVWDSTVRRWDPRTGNERMLPVTGHGGPIDHLLFSKDGARLFSAGRDRHVVEWDLQTRKGRSISPALPAASVLRAFSIAADGKTLAWAGPRPSDRTVHLCDSATGKELHALTGHDGAVIAVAFRGDGRRLISLGEDRTLRAWDAGTGKQLWQAKAGDARSRRGGFSRPLAFSPDGQRVACFMDGTLRLFDAAAGKEIRKYLYGEDFFALAWSPDSSQIALVGGHGSRVVALWDARTGELSRSWQSPQQGIYGVGFSPDGRFLATGGDENGSDIMVWELASGSKIATFAGDPSGVNPIVFSPDNRMLASGGGNSTALLWDITRRMRDGKLPPATVSGARFGQLWGKLADDDAAAAHAAIWELAAAGPRVLPMLKAKLPAATALDAKQAAKLVEQLNSDQYETRQSAMKEAEKLGLGAEPALRKALGEKPVLEPRRRVEAVVASWLRSSDWLRFRRAVAVLEYNGSAEAKKILSTLA
jgi:WD40 repeat protein